MTNEGTSERGLPLGVILTAGLGTRLRPLTPSVPKPLVPLVNRPLIAYALELMVEIGCSEVAIVVGPDDGETGRWARAHAPDSLTVSIAVQRAPRGPGDAVVSVGEALNGRSVAVLAVDTVLVGAARPAVDAFMRSAATAGLLLHAVDEPRSFGVAVLEGDRVTHFEEKPDAPRSNLALVGLWLLAPGAVERVRARPVINAKGESDLSATVAAMVDERSDVRGWRFDGAWLDGGTLDGLLHAHNVLLEALVPPASSATQIGDASPPAAVIVVDDSASVTRSHVRGPAVIAADASIVDSTVGPGIAIGEGAQLRSVVLRRSIVAAGASIEGVDLADVVITASGEIAGPGAP